MALYQIGPEIFLSIDRPEHPAGIPDIITQRTEVHSELGLDGVSIRKIGMKGVPFQVRTLRDCVDSTEAAARVDAYKLMAAQEWGIVWNGLNMLSYFSVTHVVLDVGQFVLKKISHGVGGVSGNSTYMVEAIWTLIATEPSA